MTKLKNTWLSKNFVFIAAFIIPILIMVGIYIGRGIYPFGDRCFLRSDMYHQYAPFYMAFYDKLKSGSSLAYSWNIGMGVNFTALYAYYLASPFNWLMVLSPRENILEFMSVMIILKIALSSLNFSIYIGKRFKTKSVAIIFFGLFYAFSGYVAGYSWNIMWLDCIAFFPLVVLGLERLINEDKCLLYCLSLGLCIISNYYISIMICIILVLYFIALVFTFSPSEYNFKTYFRKFFNFFIYSLIAGSFAAFLIIPEFTALQMTASGTLSFPSSFKTYFDLMDMGMRHFINIEPAVLSGYSPNVYCGVAVLMLLPLYIINETISTKEKIAKVSLIFFMILSFNINILNFIWHGFHFPNSLSCRQAFIYIFIILTMAYDAFKDIKYYSRKQIVGVFWGVILFVVLSEKLQMVEDSIPIDAIYLTILFEVLYLLLIYLYRNDTIMKGGVIFLSLVVVITEVTINTEQTSVYTTGRTYYVSDNAAITEISDRIQEQNTEFYRIEKESRRTKNDTAWHNIRGVSLFSSTASSPLTEFLADLGFINSTNAYSFQGATPLTSAMLSVKYVIDSELSDTDSLSTLYDFKDDVYVYENKYTLPIAYMVSDNLESKWYTNQANPLKVQNSLANLLTKDAGLFSVVSATSNKNTVTIHNNEPKHLYVWITSNGLENVTVTYGDGSTRTFGEINHKYVLDLGFCEVESIEISTEDISNLNLTAYALDEEIFKKTFEELNKNPLIVEEYNDTSIIGSVNVTEDGLLLTSIPYEKGWKVYVDYAEVTPVTFKDALLAIHLTEGNHVVKFEYEVPGLKTGLLITGGGVLLLAIIITIKKISKIIRKKIM